MLPHIDFWIYVEEFCNSVINNGESLIFCHNKWYVNAKIQSVLKALKWSGKFCHS